MKLYGISLLDDLTTLQAYVETNKVSSWLRWILDGVEEEETDAKTVAYDVYRPSMDPASSLGPNAPAHMNGLVKFDTVTGDPAHFREGLPVPPEILDDAENGSGNPRLRERVERLLMKSIDRLQERIELALAILVMQARRGTMTVTRYDGGPSATVDTKLPAAHKIATVTASWATSTTDIVGDLLSAGRLLEREGVSRDDILIELNHTTMANILANDGVIATLSDMSKDEVLREGRIKRIAGMQIEERNTTYVAANGTATAFIADNEVFLSSRSTKVKLMKHRARQVERDCEANAHGWYGKQVQSDDPSGVLEIVGFHGLPFLEVPYHFVHFVNTTAT